MRKFPVYIFALILITSAVCGFVGGGCDEQTQISADSASMPTATQAKQVMGDVAQLKATSKEAQQTGKLMMTIMIIALILIGIALPCLFWLLQRQMMISQEKRVLEKLSQREASIKGELLHMEQKMMDVNREQRQQLIAELEELRAKSVELDRTTREMFTEALHNFKNTRFIRRPGFFAKIFGIGKNRKDIPENTTIIQIHRPENEKKEQ